MSEGDSPNDNGTLTTEYPAPYNNHNKELMSMTNEELLEALNKRFDSIEDRLGKLEEGQEEMRDSLNTLIGWADDVACVVKVPLKPAN